MTNETRENIKKMTLECAIEGEDFAQKYVKMQLILGRDNPKGIDEHIKTLIFDQKGSILGNKLGSIWVYNNCPNIYEDYIIEYFLGVLEQAYNELYKLFYDEVLSIELLDNNILKIIKESCIGSFFHAAIIVNLLDKELNNIIPITTKFEMIKQNLKKYRFYELSKVKSLTDPDQLIQLLVDNKTPYSIALFDFLDFSNFILKEYANYTVGKTNKIISEILDVNIHTIKGNRNSLIKTSERGEKRYTAHTYVETVKKDYNSLK
ncbi:hypothetical protein [Pedobacter panaciterrae]|uniref:hypothetical protein n=1 Tax=Pedobacter panaciterrae TaxID=363849 RepID=UPI002591D4F6|nr:hypothetical protein [uncultured Pedobacter sp.]